MILIYFVLKKRNVEHIDHTTKINSTVKLNICVDINIDNTNKRVNAMKSP